VTERARTPFRKKFSEERKPERLSGTFPDIAVIRLGVSCYPAALLSNKQAYLVQFLKKTNSSPSEFWVTLCLPKPSYFRKIALVTNKRRNKRRWEYKTNTKHNGDDK
jgi:hypothetical protein